jgi:DNA-directed RNA polymerase subunit RPC12/RpoP
MTKILNQKHNPVICENCGCAIEYDHDDIKSGSSYVKWNGTYQCLYVQCPKCSNKIVIKGVMCKSTNVNNVSNNTSIERFENAHKELPEILTKNLKRINVKNNQIV